MTLKFEVFVHLLTLFMQSVKLLDYTVTDIMVTMATQCSKAVEMCTKSAKVILSLKNPKEL